MTPIVLNGISWNHSRALPPLVTTAQRFEELHPGVQIRWSKRTLHEFGHADLPTLAEKFDLLVIDHPMCGDAEVSGAVHDLVPLLTPAQVDDLRKDSLGPSFASYVYRDRLYALPIDAAAPAASYRADLLEKLGVKVPETWEDVMELARSGVVSMPGFSADLFLNFLGLCATRNGSAATLPEELVDREVAVECLELLTEFAALMSDRIYEMNPIALYEEMARGDSIAYCPFAYTYSNYSRSGFGASRLRFVNPVSLGQNTPLRTVLGGTGIAISSGCKNTEVALQYCLFTAGSECQQTLYGLSGGQPARRSAWQNTLLNQIADNFFVNTAASMERAWVRPRYPGYVALQVSAGDVLAQYCRDRSNATHTLNEIDRLYRESFKDGR